MKLIREYLVDMGFGPTSVKYLSTIAMIIFIALICFIANLITKKIIIRIITHIIKNNRFEWDNILLERKVFRKISHIVPAIIIYNFRNFFGVNFEYLFVKGVTVYVILVVLAIMNSLLKIGRATW